MKGYYGGENVNGTNPPNGGNTTNLYEVMAYINEGTREVLIVSVDITYDHSRTAAWTMELEQRGLSNANCELLPANCPWRQCNAESPLPLSGSVTGLRLRKAAQLSYEVPI